MAEEQDCWEASEYYDECKEALEEAKASGDAARIAEAEKEFANARNRSRIAYQRYQASLL